MLKNEEWVSSIIDSVAFNFFHFIYLVVYWPFNTGLCFICLDFDTGFETFGFIIKGLLNCLKASKEGLFLEVFHMTTILDFGFQLTEDS